MGFKMDSTANLRHDIRRNVCALNAGFEMLKKKSESDFKKCGYILDEMAVQTKATLELIEKLFTKYDLKPKREEP